MTLWMLYAILFGCLAAGAGFALERGARSLKVPTRFVWLAVLFVAIVLPFGLPVVSASTPPRSTVEFTERPAASAGPVIPVITAPSWIDRLIDRARNFDQPLMLFWIGLSTLCLGRFTTAIIKLRRQRSQWVAREIVGTECFVTEDIGPAVVAIPDTRIVVPQWVLALDHDSLATVIRHERQHKLARDGWLIVTGSVATALLPWNPAMWLIQRRLRLAVEMDCDARVLAEETRVDRYGSLLLAIAQRPQLMAGLGATLTESTSDLERRIAAMTARPPKNPRTRAALFAAAGVVAIAIACSMPAPDMVGPRAINPTAVPVTAPGVFFDFQVEKPASANPSNMPPRYPDQLRAAGVQGAVIGKFVVDTTGLADMRSFEVLKSDHEGFTTAVREALPAMRFYPAEVAGRRVKQLVQMPFNFSLVGGSERAPQPTAPRSPIVLYETPTSDFKVDRPASAQPTNMPPRYPDALRSAGIQGTVIGKFVVDTFGHADMRSFVLIKSDHSGFTEAVREALPKMRFYPARVGGRPVKQLIQMPFNFSLAGGSERAPQPTASRSPIVLYETPTDGSMPTLLPSNAPPVYPAQLRAANIEGMVQAKFVVRADGKVDMGSFMVIRSDHEAFTAAVRAAAEKWEFRPAMKDGKPAAKLIQMPFMFSLAR